MKQRTFNEIQDLEKEVFNQVSKLPEAYRYSETAQEYSHALLKKVVFPRLKELDNLEMVHELIFYFGGKIKLSKEENDELMSVYREKFGEEPELKSVQKLMYKISELTEVYKNLRKLHRQNVVDGKINPDNLETILELFEEYLPDFEDVGMTQEFEDIQFLKNHYLSELVTVNSDESIDLYGEFTKAYLSATHKPLSPEKLNVERDVYLSLDAAIEKVKGGHKTKLKEYKEKLGQQLLKDVTDWMLEPYYKERDILN